jgi:hypothetical protein
MRGMLCGSDPTEVVLVTRGAVMLSNAARRRADMRAAHSPKRPAELRARMETTLRRNRTVPLRMSRQWLQFDDNRWFKIMEPNYKE